LVSLEARPLGELLQCFKSSKCGIFMPVIGGIQSMPMGVLTSEFVVEYTTSVTGSDEVRL